MLFVKSETSRGKNHSDCVKFGWQLAWCATSSQLRLQKYIMGSTTTDFEYTYPNTQYNNWGRTSVGHRDYCRDRLERNWCLVVLMNFKRWQVSIAVLCIFSTSTDSNGYFHFSTVVPMPDELFHTFSCSIPGVHQWGTSWFNLRHNHDQGVTKLKRSGQRIWPSEKSSNQESTNKQQRSFESNLPSSDRKHVDGPCRQANHDVWFEQLKNACAHLKGEHVHRATGHRNSKTYAHTGTAIPKTHAHTGTVQISSQEARRQTGSHQCFYYRKRGSASYIVREMRLVSERQRERDTERERERERERDGSDVTIVYTIPCQKFTQLAMSLHFPLPKIRTFHFSLHTSRTSLPS